MTVTARPRLRRLVAAAALTIALAVPAFVRTSTSSALPNVAGCGVAASTATRCPSVLERSPDMPSFNKSMAADGARHRVYSVGPDAGGWESFSAIDTRNGERLAQRSFRATAFTHYYDYAINSLAAVLTPDGRTIISAGFVYQPDAWQAGVVAIDTTTGQMRWSWVGPHRGVDDTFEALVVDPSGRRVYAVGREANSSSGSFNDHAVIRSFDARSGRQLWHADVATSGGVDQWFSSVQYVGRHLIATGSLMDSSDNVDQLAASLNPRTGKVLRVRRFDDGGDEFGVASAVLPSGDVVLTGETSPRNAAFDATGAGVWDVDTRALDPRTLAQRWHEQTTNGAGLGATVDVVGDHTVIGFTTPAPGVFPDPTSAAPSAELVDRPGLLILQSRTGRELHRWTNLLPATEPTFFFAHLRTRGATAYIVGAASAAIAAYDSVLPGIGTTYLTTPTDGIVAAVDLSTGGVRWTSEYNDDPNGADRCLYDDLAVMSDGVFVSGSVDTRSRLPFGGAVNGAVLRYDP